MGGIPSLTHLTCLLLPVALLGGLGVGGLIPHCYINHSYYLLLLLLYNNYFSIIMMILCYYYFVISGYIISYHITIIIILCVVCLFYSLTPHTYLNTITKHTSIPLIQTSKHTPRRNSPRSETDCSEAMPGSQSLNDYI